MKIIVARHAGFCFGVKRAVELAQSLANPNNPVYTIGDIIHNTDVVEALKAQNVYPVESPLDAPIGSTVIIRSHGVPPEVYDDCAKRNLVIQDATCPYVRKIHEIVRQAAADGDIVCIAGQASHPEVVGIRGWAGPNAIVLSDPEAAFALPKLTRAVLVAQTTLTQAAFLAIEAALKSQCTAVVVHNTICSTTAERQKEAQDLAQICTKMVIVGGRHSSNTKKLYDLCKNICKQTQTIENPGQLLLEKIQVNDIIGIVAGASTPDWMIREVVTVMNELEKTTAESIEMEATTAEAPQAEPKAQEEAALIEAAQVEEVAAEPVPEEATKAEEPAAVEEPEQVPVAVEEPAQEPAAVEEPAQEPVAAPEPDASTEAADPDSFAEAFEKTLVRIRNGQIIAGSVVQIVDGEVCVNIGYKSDGFIPRNEFSSDPDVNPSDIVKVGDSIEVEVLKVNDGEGNVLLSRKNVEGKKLWDELMADAETEGKVFDAVGKEVVKGGLIATINGVRAFVPASHVSIRYVENLSDFVGKPMRLSVIEVDKARKRIVASQKNVLLAEAEAEKKKKWATLEVGAKMPGIVRRLTDFGAFVDIGGIDGLVHVTDIAWGRVKHPSDVLKINQQIEVLVLNVDAEKERISLGYKQLQPKPWTLAADKYPVGSIVEGKVVRIVPFGAFVALEPTIDGLIHISQVSVKRIAKVEDEINVGEMIRCKILDVNTEAKRISLSRKEVILQENPEIAAEIAAERAERDRQYAERQEQRQVERQQQSQQQRSDRPSRDQRFERPARSSSPSAPFGDRSDRGDRRRRNEDGDYELPPVQSTTTSLADLLQGIKFDDQE